MRVWLADKIRKLGLAFNHLPGMKRDSPCAKAQLQMDNTPGQILPDGAPQTFGVHDPFTLTERFNQLAEIDNVSLTPSLFRRGFCLLSSVQPVSSNSLRLALFLGHY